MPNQTFTPANQSLFALFKQALSGDNQEDLTKGSIGRAAFLLSVPMVLEMMMESVFAITDIFFVAALGSSAIAVVGLTEGIITLLYAVAIGLGMAVTATVARRVGEDNIDGANHVAAQTIWLGLGVALAVGIPGSIYAIDLLQLMGATKDVALQGEGYASVMFGGCISILFLFLFNAIFRGAGDAKIAMKSLWLASGINIVLDPMLIFGIGPFPEMGLTGAAVATTIGRSIGVLYQLYHLFSIKGKIQVCLDKLKLDFAVIGGLLKVSVGGVLQFLIATASWVFLVRIVSHFGSDAVAGYTVAVRVMMFAILPAWGLSNAAATLVGQNLGANQALRAEQSVWAITKYNLIFMLFVAVVFYLFSSNIIKLFSEDNQVIFYGAQCLELIAYGYGFFAIGMTLVQAFNGAGDTMTPTAINFVCYWLLQIPIAYWLAVTLQMGPSGVFLAISIASFFIAIGSVILFRVGRWKTIQV
ncbi:MATE family efflux transporter [uncultured Paraglaciecola sp.]|uniref:MATE family efflux transporter n=1 Tax=uncultured Paraglaciecola sp. TaxID=1765024 RepID=UPI002612B05E|nr:MATE family efflux transporter [uncultured Paraglaciecola sp.]